MCIRDRTEYDIMMISASEPTGNSPTERFVESMLASFAQMDNDVKSERTKNGMRARFLSGLSNGLAPLGYKRENGYTIKDSESWDKVKEAWELMATGTKTLNEMAELMNKQGLRHTYKGRKTIIRKQSLSKIFRNKYYMGMLTSLKYPEEVRGQHLPMVTEALFYRVQAVIDGRNNSIHIPISRRNRDNVEFPLRRLVQCSICLLYTSRCV